MEDVWGKKIKQWQSLWLLRRDKTSFSHCKLHLFWGSNMTNIIDNKKGFWLKIILDMHLFTRVNLILIKVLELIQTDFTTVQSNYFQINITRHDCYIVMFIASMYLWSIVPFTCSINKLNDNKWKLWYLWLDLWLCHICLNLKCIFTQRIVCVCFCYVWHTFLMFIVSMYLYLTAHSIVQWTNINLTSW